MKQRLTATVDNMTARREKFGIFLMVASSCCVCIGQLLWKMSISGDLLYLCMGFLLHGVGFTAMVTAYKYGNLSKLQPILSINYVLAVLIGYIVFDESISFYKMVGIIIITASVVAIGKSVD